VPHSLLCERLALAVTYLESHFLVQISNSRVVDHPALRGFCILVLMSVMAPCMATIAVTRRETNSWKWALLQFLGLSAHETLAKSIEEIQVRLKEHNCLLDRLKEGGER